MEATRPPVLRSERAIVFLIASVQFINILDFVMVMPLGPDFARALGIPTSALGIVGGSYTLAAAVSGLLGSVFLDRFDRRKALALAMGGLVLGTAAGGFATGMGSLIAARVVAGFFGGPATSLSFSIITDVIPPQRRGKAMGAVMGAFSAASVLGVPAGLYLAQHLGWRAPFFAVALTGMGVVGAAIALLPPMTAHLKEQPSRAARVSTREFLSRRPVQLSYLMTAVVMMGGFIVIPNISAFLQGNLGYPRAQLGLLYLVGGVVSFGVVRLVGYLVDRYGSFRVGSFGCGLMVSVVFLFFYRALPGVPVLLMFVLLMIAMSFRNVAYNTLTSKVPEPAERARFQSLQSAVQHLASAGGALLSAWLLTERPAVDASGTPRLDPGGRPLVALVGMPKVALISIGLSLLVPLLIWVVERHVRTRSATSKSVASSIPEV